MLISVQVYSCNHHCSIALACTETGIKTRTKNKQKNRQEKSHQKNPCSGSNADAEIKVRLLRTQSCESFPFKSRE